jgi:hypothetical protein
VCAWVVLCGGGEWYSSDGGKGGGGAYCVVVGGELDVAWSAYFIIPNLVWYFL